MIDHNLTTTESIQQNYAGMYKIVTMNLTITVFCEESFGGSDCTQCVPGLTGPNCNMIDRCFGVNCSGNGEFKCDAVRNSFNCTCHDGYKGDVCEDIDCLTNDCSGNGVCIDNMNSLTRLSTGSCNCSTGFTGRVCEININDCLSNPCHERGHCVDGVNLFQCACDPGFTGDRCQTNIDDCVGVDCSGNGQCEDGVNNFTCQCTAGFSGPQCSESGIMTF